MFQFTVSGVEIQMEMIDHMVNETDGTVAVCAQIADLPGDLQTNLTVTFSTSNSDGKAGL